jgi:hypothetical protein
VFLSRGVLRFGGFLNFDSSAGRNFCAVLESGSNRLATPN